MTKNRIWIKSPRRYNILSVSARTSKYKFRGGFELCEGFYLEFETIEEMAQFKLDHINLIGI